MTDPYPRWEEYAAETYRLKVPGGWLYRQYTSNTLTFVPEVPSVDR